MKNPILANLVASRLDTWNETESVRNEFNGNEKVYALDQGSDYNVIAGVVIVPAKADCTHLEVN